MSARTLATDGSHRSLESMLAAVPHFTMTTIRTNTVVPEHLLVVGADADSCTAAQAYRRLGADVTMIAPGALLPEEDRDLVAVLRDALMDDGIAIFERARFSNLAFRHGRIEAYLRHGAVLQSIEASHLLLASTKAPRRKTGAKPWSGTPVRVIRTEPVLAHAGLTEGRMRRFSDAVLVMRGSAYGAELGGRHHIKAVCTTHGALLGVTIVGPRAFEHLQPWVLALDAGLDIDSLCVLPHVAGWFVAAQESVPRLATLTHRAIQRSVPAIERRAS